MSIPNPVGMPGGRVTRNGSPASTGIGRRRGRIGITWDAIAGHSRSLGRSPIARIDRLDRGRLDAVAEVHASRSLPALRRRFARRRSRSLMRAL